MCAKGRMESGFLPVVNHLVDTVRWTDAISKIGSLLVVTLCATGCTSLLPRTHTESTSFATFEDARRSIDALIPMKGDTNTLAQNGFNPLAHPNTTILTHADIVRRFVPAAVLTREDLDPGIIACLKALDTCHGMEIVSAKIARERKGNFFADFTNFSRRTETSGWRFNAVILFVKDIVVYRSWGGQPLVNEVELTTNPLGPFQDIGPSALIPR